MNNLQPYSYVIKKYLLDLLKERYSPNDLTVSRIAHNISNTQDAHAFVKLIVDAYECGYLKAVNDYRQELRKLGYDVTIVPENQKKVAN